MNPSPALLVRALSKTFHPRRRPVLENVSFSIAAGECLAVIGRSGAGKSTLARCLTGLVQFDSGTVEIDGQLHQPNRRLQRRLIQMVWQDGVSAFSPFSSIRALLGEPLHAFGIGPPESHDSRIEELLQAVGLPRTYLERRPHQISGGEAQRVGIARALAPNPRVLILDEPLSALDPPTQAEILPLLRAASHSTTRAVLLIAHDLTAVRQLADRVLFLDHGRAIANQSIVDFFSAPAHPAAADFLQAWPPLPF